MIIVGPFAWKFNFAIANARVYSVTTLDTEIIIWASIFIAKMLILAQLLIESANGARKDSVLLCKTYSHDKSNDY